MSRLNILMIVSSSNNPRAYYFPNNSSQNLINEIGEVSHRVKTILNKGIIETDIYKFTYEHYLPKESKVSLLEEEDNEIRDHPVIIICSDKSYQNYKIEQLFKEIFESLNLIKQKNANISKEGKSKIGKIFLKYQNMNNIKESNIQDIEFGSIEEFIGLDKSESTSSKFYEISDTMNDAKKRSKLRHLEKKKREEIENIKSWKKIKCLFLFINIILLMGILYLIFIFKGDLFNFEGMF